MPVDIDIAKVAQLARLALTDDELAGYETQLQDILEHTLEVARILVLLRPVKPEVTIFLVSLRGRLSLRTLKFLISIGC